VRVIRCRTTRDVMASRGALALCACSFTQLTGNGGDGPLGCGTLDDSARSGAASMSRAAARPPPAVRRICSDAPAAKSVSAQGIEAQGCATLGGRCKRRSQLPRPRPPPVVDEPNFGWARELELRRVAGVGRWWRTRPDARVVSERCGPELALGRENRSASPVCRASRYARGSERVDVRGRAAAGSSAAPAAKLWRLQQRCCCSRRDALGGGGGRGRDRQCALDAGSVMMAETSGRARPRA
jgi:hypothetical protein